LQSELLITIAMVPTKVCSELTTRDQMPDLICYQFQTGAPIYFSSDIPLDPSVTSFRQITIQPRQVSGAALNTAAFVTTSNPSGCTGPCDGSTNVGGQFFNHYRTLPQTFSWVRQDGYNNLDASILKNFTPFSLPRTSRVLLRAPSARSRPQRRTVCRARSRSVGGWCSN
jgi:hypothetical protein